MGLKVRTILLMTVFFLVFLTSFSFFSTNANAWPSGWNYRKSHTITGSTAGAQTNYQMNITVYNITGTDSGSNVYVGNKAKLNFGDIRFTDSSDNLLDYWIEEFGTTYAKFWIEIPSIPASPGTVTIYMYYGNSGATNISSLEATATKPVATTYTHSSSGSEANNIADTSYPNHADILSTLSDNNGGTYATSASGFNSTLSTGDRASARRKQPSWPAMPSRIGCRAGGSRS